MCMGMDHGSDESRETPLEILKRRFASGEITQDRFEEMRRLLQDTGPSHHGGTTT
ncbi:MAG TPA: SHOCT domain-containing protein [Thermoplasmata archaeon]|nr:SHOCT domain-containing protein [Thermoplasmata archaeon]HLB68488.1 SHOCT domain-containing protein [Thermoplasmata archaeon]